MLARAGYRNASDSYGLDQWGMLPLETLLRDPPDVIFTPVSGPGDEGRALAVRHRALRALEGRTRVIAFPDRLLFCGGPTVIEAMGVLKSRSPAVLSLSKDRFSFDFKSNEKRPFDRLRATGYGCKGRRMTARLSPLLILAFILSLAAGKVWIMPGQWFGSDIEGLIFLELRLPRALLGAAIGAALGLSGAVLQGLLRNPLADPTVVGVSSSAALGGVLAILAGLTGWAMFGAAMAGAALAVLLLASLAGRSGGPLGFILAGMVLSTLAGSLTAFVISIAPNPFATAEIVTWLMGALTDRGMEDAMRALPCIAIGMGTVAGDGSFA